MTAATSTIDRPGAIRAALRELVAERGFHGASMGAVARRAGVATGTAYVHYDSKDDLVLAAYLEAKHDLGQAALDGIEHATTPREQFLAMWLSSHRHLWSVPDDARFLVQVDGSPYAAAAHQFVLDVGDDPIMAELDRSGLWTSFIDLPPDVLYDLGLAPAVRLAARGIDLGDDDLYTTAHACWAAVTTVAPPAPPTP